MLGTKKKPGRGKEKMEQKVKIRVERKDTRTRTYSTEYPEVRYWPETEEEEGWCGLKSTPCPLESASVHRRVFVARAAPELFFVGMIEDKYMGGEGEPRDETGRDMEDKERGKEREETHQNWANPTTIPLIHRRGGDEGHHPRKRIGDRSSARVPLHIGTCLGRDRRVLGVAGDEESSSGCYTSLNRTRDGGSRTSCSMVVKISARTGMQRKKAERGVGEVGVGEAIAARMRWA
ncbi:hypothetical protein B0H13DRAFT_1899417 [Mycena leptocephala]|nr:hypothetical protein B0H13DRAFT_1899417 [Mycena leptocephala]